MKLSKNQAGIAHLVLIIVVVVLTLTALVGWIVYDRRQSKNPDTNIPAKEITSFDECVAAGNPVMESYPEQCAANGKTFANPNQKVEASKDETADWLLYEPPGKEYSVRLADGWVVDEGYDGSGFNTFDTEALNPKPGTSAIVKPYPGGRDGSNGFFFNYATQNVDQIVTNGTKQTSLKTNDGIEIEKYFWVVSGYSGEGMGPSNGDSEYTYVIRKSANRVIVVGYSFRPGSTDNFATIEKVLKTVRFN